MNKNEEIEALLDEATKLNKFSNVQNAVNTILTILTIMNELETTEDIPEQDGEITTWTT